MKIVLIGSGNLATHLAQALQQAHYPISLVFSKTLEHAETLAEKLRCTATDSIDDIPADADVYLFSIKDDALRTVAAAIPHKPESIFIHTAGSVSLDIFKGTATHYGVLYPMQTFSKGRPVDFSVTPCFIEGSDDIALRCVNDMASAISENVMVVESEKRKKLHLAAVFACNMTNHCYRLAEKVLEPEGIPFQLYLPLIRETAEKVAQMSPKDAQTGPMVRYDRSIMSLQLSMLNDERTKDIYRLMAESIHEDIDFRQKYC